MARKLTFAFEKKTDVTFRFEEVTDALVVSTYCVKIAGLAHTAPAEFTVEITITPATGEMKVLTPILQDEGDDYPGYPCPDDPDGLHHVGCGCEW